MKITKTLLVLLTVLFCGFQLSAGTLPGSYIVVSNGTAIDVTPYTTAIFNADLESFRYQDKRCTLEFDNGLKVELLSANEVQAMGTTLNVGDYKIDDTPGWIQPIFHLNADGTLSAMYTKPNLKQSTQTHH